MKLWRCLSFLALWAGLISVTEAQFDSGRAAQIWDQVLKVKGGRDRLWGIESFLHIDSRPKEVNRPQSVELIAFPDKHWLWFDQTGTVLGGNLTVSNALGEWRVSKGRNGRPNSLNWTARRDYSNDMLLRAQVFYLLETKWLQPKILKHRKERLGRQEFDVLTLDFGRESSGKKILVDYFVDPVTHLIRRVEFDGTWEFEDYVEVDEILMPSRVRYGRITYLPLFDFNVPYDPSIFDRRPSLEDGPEGWRLPR